MTPVRIGVLGARSMIARLALYGAIADSAEADLVAVAASSGPVPDHVAHLDSGSYDELIADPDIDAVYIALPNDMHRPWAIAAMTAGKHVLCEKPLGRSAHDAEAMFAVAAETGTVLAEAWMTPFDPRWSDAIGRAANGELGDLRSIDASFTFTIGPEAAGNYRWDPDKGGGALADVGVYCLGAVEALWGLEPDDLEASIVWSELQDGASGPTDATTSATLRWADGRAASIRCSFVEQERQRLEIVGSDGSLVIDGDAFTGGVNATEFEMSGPGGVTRVTVEADNLYRRMVDQFSRAVHNVEPWSRSPESVTAMLGMVDQIRARSHLGNTEADPDATG